MNTDQYARNQEDEYDLTYSNHSDDNNTYDRLNLNEMNTEQYAYDREDNYDINFTTDGLNFNDYLNDFDDRSQSPAPNNNASTPIEQGIHVLYLVQ